MSLPLLVLSFGAIFVGYLGRDMVIGAGTDFFKHSIFVLPEHLKHNPFLWIKSVLEGGAPRHQKVPNDSASLIHLQDLARLFLAAYEDSSASGRYFGVLESFHWNDIYKECQKLIPDMLMPEPILEDPVAPTQFDFKRRDSLGIKIRDFPTIMRETVEWLKSNPFKEN